MKKIVIVGGGLAGALAAKIVLQYCPLWSVVLVEDPRKKGGGGIQGENVTSSFINLVQELMGHENTSEWLEYSNAALRVGAKFVGWGKEDFYIPQYMNRGQVLILAQWAQKHRTTTFSSSSEALDSMYEECYPSIGMMKGTVEVPIIDVNSPESTEEHEWSANLDGSLLAEYIMNSIIEEAPERFQYLPHRVEEVLSCSGEVSKLVVGGKELRGDLYIDASGPRGILVEGVGRKYLSEAHRFPNNKAVFGNVKGGQGANYVNSSTARAGWMWDIPLKDSTSVGYIYCSDFISEEEALSELKSVYPELSTYKQVSISPRTLANPWAKNVIAIGVSQGLVDPLLATTLLRTKTHLLALVEALQSDPGHIQVDKFNRACADHNTSIMGWVEMYYRGCGRRDTEYWKYVSRIPYISKGLSDFISYDTHSINNRYFDWEKWTISATALNLININRIL